jgi:methionyl-tRNA formyltransferase
MSTTPSKNSGHRAIANAPRYIFFGTPEFSARILRRLIDAGMTPSAVVTAPDEPVGRKQVITPPPAKVIAQEHGIPVLQPERVRSELFFASIRAHTPDVLVVVAYGKILPKDLLAAAPKGALNVHPSLLPRWRGPAPIQYALLSELPEDEKTGVSIMLLDEEVDHGPVLMSQELGIKDQEYTSASLSEKLAEMGAELLIEAIPQWVGGKIKPKEQDHSKATFSKMIRKEDGVIDWAHPAEEIERMVRAFTPWPGAYTWFEEGGKTHRLRIVKAHCKEGVSGTPGSVIKMEDKKIAVRCGKNGADLLVLDTVQPENKSPMDGYAFSLGHPGIFATGLRTHPD